MEPNFIDTLWKIAVIAILAPLWIPVLKALYEDFDGALREEGGLFGRAPTPGELERLRNEGEAYESPLTNEPLEQGGRPSRASAERQPESRGAGPGPARGGAAPSRDPGRNPGRGPGRRRGFVDR